MTINKGLFTSLTDNWATPQFIFNSLNNEFKFTLDVCADIKNYKVKKYFDKEINGLEQDWSKDVCFMNPPYGREIKHWVKKAYLESKKGAVVVCLLPSRTDTIWWHDYIMQSKDIRFLKGRLKFNDSLNSAPFPSVIVVFNER